jgi:hypothetical protein
MATTKKATTGKKAGAGARKGATKAKGVAKTTKTRATAKAAPAPPKREPVKLNDRQREFLQKVKDAGESGYTAARSSDQRTIDALAARKLLKKRAKNKETGKTPYLLTKAAASHLPAVTPPVQALAPEPVAAPIAAPAAAPPQATAVAPAPPPAM